MADGKFVAYYRVSTRKQGQSGLGLEAQRDAVHAYLNGGNWTLIGEYTETESGTRKGNGRPQLAAALAQAKRDKATLVIAKWDRLGRNVAFVATLLESGVEFVATDMPSANRLTIHIMAAVAEEEARMISKRTKDALAAAKARGVKLGTPMNLTAEAQAKSAQINRLKAHKDYSHLERLVLEMLDKGQSLRKIADHLNNSGERTRNGATFTAATIKRLADRARPFT
jgi:DNA invertase Pin-like site-specific DNA recombinase